jgi:enoyl-CoA hydratase/carnithine racemase
MGKDDVVLSEIRDGVLTLTLNRPRKLNAMSHEVFDAIAAGVVTARDTREVRSMVITGAGTIFCAGADISMVKEFGDRELGGEQFRVKLRRLQAVFDSLEQLEKPVIAAINGPCVGGGFDLVLACDFRIAVREAFMLIPEALLGLIPDLGGTVRLPRLVGVARAKEMILTGRRFTADECLAMGLLNRVVTREELPGAVGALAAELARNAPLAIGVAKQAIDRAWGADVRTGEELEAYAQTPLYRSDDAREGYAAFIEKRQPKWTGR